MEPIAGWRWPTRREMKLYGFALAVGIVLAEVALFRDVGANLRGIVLVLLVGLGSAPLALPICHVVRLYMLHGGSDRWSDD